MKILTLLPQITPTKQRSRPQEDNNPLLRRGFLQLPSTPPRTWKFRRGAKGFANSTSPSSRKMKNKETNTPNNQNDEDDDKIPEVVWNRMVTRILIYVGLPLLMGFGLLQIFSIVKSQEWWDVPIWLPYLTTLITFGASALGIAFGSLSTSLDPAEEGSVLGLEQVGKNWIEMWKEEEKDDDDEDK